VSPVGPLPIDVAGAAQAAAEAHVGACSEWLFASEELPAEEWPEFPAVGAYCGCATCTVREAVAAAWPVWLAGVLAQLRGDGHHAAAADLERAAARVAPPVPASTPNG
jgi:hypothetical protein